MTKYITTYSITIILFLSAMIIVDSSSADNGNNRAQTKRKHDGRRIQCNKNNTAYNENDLRNITKNILKKRVHRVITEQEIPIKFKKLFTKTTELHNKANVEKLITHPNSDGNNEYTNACNTRTRKYMPKTELNIHNKKRVIIQTKVYKQVVDIVECINAEKPCLLSESLLSYETSCKQEMANIRLVALTDTERMIVEYFPMRAACSCYFKKKF